MMTRAAIALLAANLLLAFPVLCLPRPIQSRDHLTPQEVDLVKDAQILDQRIEVFIKAADRRLLVLRGVDAGSTKQLKKDSEKWGELPTGTQAELIRDIANILDEAITNIDDVSTRDERNPLIQKALRKLAMATTRIVDQLKPLRAQAKGDAQIGSFEQLMENAESIVQAANRLPPPAEKKEIGKGEKSKDKN
jgi:hypothetical protein